LTGVSFTAQTARMDEDEFKDTVYSLNTLPCAFEKALLTRRCDCSQAERLFVAERQTIRCGTPTAQRACRELLQQLHDNARFALHTAQTPRMLAHAKEIKVQMGGLTGLCEALDSQADTDKVLADVHALVETAQTRFGNLAALPYSRIVRAISAYQPRPARR
jgi:hypothetical protein